MALVGIECSDFMHPEADWIISMRSFFNTHGYYRIEDIIRLLGPPNIPITNAFEGHNELSRNPAP